MIGAALTIARERWEAWTGRPPRTPLRPLVLTNAEKAGRRLIVMVFERGADRPAVVVKLAVTGTDSNACRAEHRALHSIRDRLPASTNGLATGGKSTPTKPAPTSATPTTMK